MMWEWSRIQGGNEIFNVPSNMLEYNMKVRKGVLLTSHEVGTVENRTEMRTVCP